MSVLFILIGISVLVAVAFLTLFLWSVRSGQYEDDFTPSIRMLFDDNDRSTAASSNKRINLNNQ